MDGDHFGGILEALQLELNTRLESEIDPELRESYREDLGYVKAVAQWRTGLSENINIIINLKKLYLGSGSARDDNRK